MTEQEYREALHRIMVKAENEKRMLAKEFATEHNQVKVGDYISDCFDTIRVEGWGISRRGYEYNSLPCISRQDLQEGWNSTQAPEEVQRRAAQPLASKWRTSKE